MGQRSLQKIWHAEFCILPFVNTKSKVNLFHMMSCDMSTSLTVFFTLQPQPLWP